MTQILAKPRFDGMLGSTVLCAVKAISLLTVKVSDGEQAGFGNYRSYKLDYSEKFYQTIH
ncbi:hypothetical protein ABT70_11940 [Salmonella enterica subsp. enterica serovar Typhimurium]|nr:hypothetical protein ABT70_11940 [Salmonella enterica subsp. enterica serovar Typhimurium]